ncbi:MAG TPA: amidophosphoribosyltransferase, partial [Bacteroidales bacterium]|nr:amidophosphoribosyltransferase [Bacteroidales bacterium]
CAFPNLDFEVEHYLGPGEIIEFSAEGYKQLQAPGKELKICSFLWVYYGYPPSFYEGINVDDTRYRCGAAMAREEDVKADFVAAIPDSGVGHAMGYSNETGIPLKRPYSKYTPTWPRSFMPQNQETRELVARMKLIPNKAVIKGNSGVFIDDSIVRGTQLKDNVKDLQEGGIREMHMRIACPPLLFPCKYLNFSSSRAKLDLATRKAIFDLNGEEDPDYASYCDSRSPNYQRMVNKMGKNLGLTSLKFLKLEDMIKAIGLPKEKLCTHCWDNSGKDD